MRADATDRGTSFVLTHVFTLAITAVVVTALLASASGVVDRERERTIQQGLRTVGAEAAAELAAVDRLAAGTNETTVTLRVSLPRRLSGNPYTITLAPTGPCREGTESTACLELRVSGAGVGHVIPFRNETRVRKGSVSGGDFTIVYRNRTLMIRDER